MNRELTRIDVEEKLKGLSEEEVLFIVNINNTLGSLNPQYFLDNVSVVSRALIMLQKDNLPRNIVNISMVTNKLLPPERSLNRAEIICILYYLHQHIGTIIMVLESTEMPTWSIREDIYARLRED